MLWHICKIPSVTCVSHVWVFPWEQSSVITPINFCSLSHSGTTAASLEPLTSIPPLIGRLGFRFPGRHGNRVMDVSDESDRGMEPADDLASFEVVNLSNPGLLDLSADVAGHGRQSKEKTKLKTKLVSAWNNVRYGGVWRSVDVV